MQTRFRAPGLDPLRKPLRVHRRHAGIAHSVAKLAPELVQLERSCLADLSTEELELQLKKHGISVTSSRRKKPEQAQPLQSDENASHSSNLPSVVPASGQHGNPVQQQRHQSKPQQDLDAPQQQSLQHTAVDQRQKHKQSRQQVLRGQGQQSQGQQQPVHQLDSHPQAARHVKNRSRRVATATARRALLLEELATARVQARSRIVRFPLRLSISGRAKSRRYLTLPVDVEGTGFVDFLLDSSSYLSRITPAMRTKLGFGPADGVAIFTGSSSSSSAPAAPSDSSKRGSSSGSSSSSSTAHVRLRQRVHLPKMWLGTAPLPPQQAYVTPLQLPPRQQQSIATGSSGSSMRHLLTFPGAVGGVLGVQVLREFEVDIDFGGNCVSLHPPGHVELGLCDTQGLVELPLRLTKTGGLVIPVSLAGSAPFTGLLDLSASSSMLNWEAAALLGMFCQPDLNEDSLDNSSSGGGGSSTQPGQEQQQQQQQAAAIQHVGKFGSLEVVPTSELLLKPHLPTVLKPLDSSSGTHPPAHTTPSAVPFPPPQSRKASAPSSSSSSSSGYTYTPLTSNNIVQQHKVAANEVRLVLGHARLPGSPAAAAAAAAAKGSSSSSSSSKGGLSGSLAISPPPRFGVAGLKAVAQLGLSGQPVMVVGWDIWARQRAVLCLKAGKLYLAAGPS